MAYGNRNYRRYRGRRRYTKRAAKKTDAFDMARMAWSGVKRLSRYVNTEIKYNDQTPGGTIGNTGTVINLSPIAVGDSTTTRDGNSIKPMRLSVKFHCQMTSPSTFSSVRLIIFRGNNERNILPTVAGIFENATSILSHKYDEHRFQTKFLYDKTFTMSNTGKAAFDVSFSLKLYGHINFDDTSASPLIATNGGVYALLIGEYYSATNFPGYSMISRLSYIDN